jgi:hypothetical protein
MKLVVGGRSQGKLAWAMRQFNIEENRVARGENLPLKAGEPTKLQEYSALYGLHDLLGRTLRENWNDREIADLVAELERLPEDFVVICDEIGAGLVPLERFEREWRDLVGRTCCKLAERSDEVWRIFCGLPQRIK